MSTIEKSLRMIWHPCSQMKDYESLKPLVVVKARGSYLQLDDGQQIIDAISSWWCKSLGHNHPHLKQALLAQIEDFEHVIFANTTYTAIVNLAEKLTQLTPHLSKVLFAGDGSSAVEIAIKMSLHSRQILGQSQRQRFLALCNAYHGETVGAMSVSDLGLYRQPYQTLLFPAEYIAPVYVSGPDDPLWEDISDFWPSIETQLDVMAPHLTAVIVEPIVQGAGGMLIYSADFLRRLRLWTQQHDIHLIADEIMTGFYRTGKLLACEHAGIEADFLCLGKGLTSGWMPFSAVLIREEVYRLFYADYHQGKNFLHSHTYSGNPLGACLANATLETFEKESIHMSVKKMSEILRENMLEVASNTGRLIHVRCIGAIAAADIIAPDPHYRYGFEIYQKAIRLGALLRPIGNTLYWLPPLNADPQTLTQLKEITERSLLESGLSH